MGNRQVGAGARQWAAWGLGVDTVDTRVLWPQNVCILTVSEPLCVTLYSDVARCYQEYAEPPPYFF